TGRAQRGAEDSIAGEPEGEPVRPARRTGGTSAIAPAVDRDVSPPVDVLAVRHAEDPHLAVVDVTGSVRRAADVLRQVAAIGRGGVRGGRVADVDTRARFDLTEW